MYFRGVGGKMHFYSNRDIRGGEEHFPVFLVAASQCYSIKGLHEMGNY